MMKELSPEMLSFNNPNAVPENSEGMQYLTELGRINSEIKLFEINGRVFTNSEEELFEIRPEEEDVPNSFRTFTLSGLVHFLHEDVDKLFDRFPRLYVQVDSPTCVTVYSPACNRRKIRFELARCIVQLPTISFDKYMSQEDFSIHLQTRFAQDEELETVAQLVGNIRMESEAQTADDGMSQRVTIKDGVSAVKDAIVKNPFSLRPIRTFEEVEQPKSPFVLRIRKGNGPEAAIFEADGGAWKNEAVKKIGAWLEEACKDIPVVVIA